MSDKIIVIVIIILAVVIALLGLPYALNEYSKLQDRERMNQLRKTLTEVPTPVTTARHQITDGFWCASYPMFIYGNEIMVKDCYQFFPNGSYTQGDSSENYGMLRIMAACQTASDRGVFDTWRVNVKGEYEIFLKNFTLNGDTLTCTGCNAPYTWSPTGL